VLNSTNISTVGSFKLSNDFASTVRTGLHNGSVSLSRNIARVHTSTNIPRYMSAFASNVMRVDVSDVTSVSTVLQQCTGKVVRLNIQFEIILQYYCFRVEHYHGTGSSD
jgi:hypothetical protein